MLAAHGLAGRDGHPVHRLLRPTLAGTASSNGLVYGHAGQLGWQAVAALAGPAYAFVATFVILKLVGLVMPLRVTASEEAIGLDVVQHGEEAYTSGEGAILVLPEEHTAGHLQDRPHTDEGGGRVAPQPPPRGQSGQVKPIEVHDFRPGIDEVVHELLLGVVDAP